MGSAASKPTPPPSARKRVRVPSCVKLDTLRLFTYAELQALRLASHQWNTLITANRGALGRQKSPHIGIGAVTIRSLCSRTRFRKPPTSGNIGATASSGASA